MVLRGCVSHGERTRRRVLDGSICIERARHVYVLTKEIQGQFGLRPEHLFPGLGLWLDFMHDCLVATL